MWDENRSDWIEFVPGKRFSPKQIYSFVRKHGSEEKVKEICAQIAKELDLINRDGKNKIIFDWFKTIHTWQSEEK